MLHEGAGAPVTPSQHTEERGAYEPILEELAHDRRKEPEGYLVREPRPVPVRAETMAMTPAPKRPGLLDIFYERGGGELSDTGSPLDAAQEEVQFDALEIAFAQGIRRIKDAYSGERRRDAGEVRGVTMESKHR